MNPNKPVKPMNSILNDAKSYADTYSSIRECVSKLNDMSARSKKLRDAYALLRNTKTVLTHYGITKSLLAVINSNGELEHAIKVSIPKITAENKQQVTKDVIEGIDHAISDLMDRLKIYSQENLSVVTKLTDNYSKLAVNQKSILCDLRQYVSAIAYDEQSLMAHTTLCGCSKENFAERVSALRTLHKSLTSPWNAWGRHGLSYALEKFGYKIVVDNNENLDPEEQPEEPLDPEMAVVPKGDVEEGSDSPVPDETADPNEVTPSVEITATDTMDNLGWSRKTMLDSINSLIAAVDRVKELGSCKEQVTLATESLDAVPDQPSDYRAFEKNMLTNRTYFSMCASTLEIYGREVNRLVNDTINLVVRLRSSLGAKS